MNFSKIPRHQNQEQDAADREFDAYLREIDDYLPNQVGDVSGFAIPQDFALRVVERARAEMRTAAQADAEGWPILRWFFGFSLNTRLTIASAVLLATFCGFRVGQVVTEVIAYRTKPQPMEIADPLGLAAPEQSIVQLMRTDEAVSHNQANRSAGKAAGEER